MPRLSARTLVVLAAALCSGRVGCRQEHDVAPEEAPAPAASSVATAPSAPASAAAVKPASELAAPTRASDPVPPVGSVARLEGGPPARVVFLDQEHRCPCNADQIDFAWGVVDRLRRARPGLTVERVHADRDRAREAKLRATKSFWTFPAIYVFDAQGKLVALLQGKLHETVIAEALGQTSPAAR